MSISQSPLLKGIRAVVFDVVGTLMTPSPSVDESYTAWGRKYGSKLDRATIGVRFRKAFRETERNFPEPSIEESARPVSPWRTSEQIEHARWRQIVATALDDVADQDACFSALWTHFGDPRNWKVYDDAAISLDRLRSWGLTLALATNFDSRVHRICDGQSALNSISPRFVSSEVGYRKPAREFFDAVLAGLQTNLPDLTAKQVLMVGDDRENDVGGARAAGFRAVRINRKEEPNWDEIGSLHSLAGL